MNYSAPEVRLEELVEDAALCAQSVSVTGRTALHVP